MQVASLLLLHPPGLLHQIYFLTGWDGASDGDGVGSKLKLGSEDGCKLGLEEGWELGPADG